MTELANDNRASFLWITLLTAASTGTTFVLACATPFAALAALAAMHMRLRDGLALMGLTWVASQVIGFALLNYPHDLSTICWGAGLGTAALGAAIGAYTALHRLRQAHVTVRLVAAYVAAFVAFKAVVAVWALFLGGIHITLSPSLIARQFPRDGAILLFLLALYYVLVRIGLPAARPQERLA